MVPSVETSTSSACTFADPLSAGVVGSGERPVNVFPPSVVWRTLPSVRTKKPVPAVVAENATPPISGSQPELFEKIGIRVNVRPAFVERQAAQAVQVTTSVAVTARTPASVRFVGAGSAV